MALAMDVCRTSRLSLCCAPSFSVARSSLASAYLSACGAGMSRQCNRVTEAFPLFSWIFAFKLAGGFLRGISKNSVIIESRSTKQKLKHSLLVKGATSPSDGVKWWEKKGPPNMHDISSTQEFVNALGDAGEKLVVVEFYGSWCGSCRALYPKLCKLAEEYSDVIFLKVNFDENKKMCKSLNVKVLPYFHFYRGAEGRLDGFSCSLVKLPKLKSALALHNTARCSLGPSVGVGDLFMTLDQPAAAGSKI